jgi:trk system potassium uptake protein TrkH
MQFAMAFKIIGVLLMLFSSAMLPSLFLSVIHRDGVESAFATGFGMTLLAGILLWLPTRSLKRDLNIRDGFLVTALFWLVLGVFGAIPFWLIPSLNLSGAASVFESISGLTTTGATVITGLDALPQSLLLYRQLLQWLGGIGIVVLAVAVLPMLGIGGMQLYRAESAGPSKERKLTPRITSTAKALFGIYLLLTIACAASYFFAGMTVFDAICHAFSTCRNRWIFDS